MESLASVLLFTGPATLLIGIAALLFSLASVPADRRSSLVGPSLLIAVALSLIGYFAGKSLGIEFFCNRQDAGNLCGLAGFFGTGPLGAGLLLIFQALAIYSGRRRAP